MNIKNWNSIIDSLSNYFSLNGYILSQNETEQSIREGITFRGPNILILIFAIFIASLGLNTNSTAVDRKSTRLNSSHWS